LSKPSAPGRNFTSLYYCTKNLRLPRIEPGISIVTEAGYAANHSCQQATNRPRYRADKYEGKNIVVLVVISIYHIANPK
jgi:hypothetical protein